MLSDGKTDVRQGHEHPAAICSARILPIKPGRPRDDFNRPFEELVNQYCFGEILGTAWPGSQDAQHRHALDAYRSQPPNQIRAHVRGAIANGVSKEELQELFLQAAHLLWRARRRGQLPHRQGSLQGDGDLVTVAFIGLGMMGAPMAASLARNGFKPRLFDASPAAITAFLESNDGVACSSAADAAAGADIVITMLPDGKVVQDAVLSEPNGAAKGLKPGGIVVDMSSSSPVDTEVLGKALAAAAWA